MTRSRRNAVPPKRLCRKSQWPRLSKRQIARPPKSMPKTRRQRSRPRRTRAPSPPSRVEVKAKKSRNRPSNQRSRETTCRIPNPADPRVEIGDKHHREKGEVAAAAQFQAGLAGVAGCREDRETRALVRPDPMAAPDPLPIRHRLRKARLRRQSQLDRTRMVGRESPKDAGTRGLDR